MTKDNSKRKSCQGRKPDLTIKGPLRKIESLSFVNEMLK